MAELKTDGTGKEYEDKTDSGGEGEGKNNYKRENYTEVESTTQRVEKSTPKWDMEQTEKIQPKPDQRQQPKKNNPLREHAEKANKDRKGNTHETEEESKEKSKQSYEDTNVTPGEKMGEKVAVSKPLKTGNSNKKLDGGKRPNINKQKTGKNQ